MVGSVAGLPLSLRMNMPSGLPPDDRHPPEPSTWIEDQPLPLPLLGTLRSKVPLMTWADAADTRATGTHAKNTARTMTDSLISREKERNTGEGGCAPNH